MPRYKLIIEYDGTPFHGWQRQTNGRSVQEALEHAVQQFCGESVTAHVAGRTDAGVHALGQTAHIDLTHDHPVHTVRNALNFHLKPDPVAVLAAEQVGEDFHARFSAVRRHYRYHIVNRPAPLTVGRHRAWQVPVELDDRAMHAAAQTLVGQHDFTTFRAAQCQSKSPVKTLDRLDVTREGREIVVEASARSFLHHQVRAMVGTLKWAGDGKWMPADVAEALASHDRSRSGPTAPAHGLFLVRVDYG